MSDKTARNRNYGKIKLVSSRKKEKLGGIPYIKRDLKNKPNTTCGSCLVTESNKPMGRKNL